MGCMGDTSWGWIILVFAVAMRTTIHGMLTSYGEFLATFSNVFQEPNMAFFGIIGSTAYGIISIGTPIALALTRWIGARRTVFIGVFLLSLGVALSGVVDQPLELFFTYGLLGGCGALLTNNPPFFLLSQYFHRDHKYYILTSSLPMVSFCLGSLIFNPIIQAMITSIGWKCTFAVYATLIFTVGCTAAATFRENEDQDENDKTSLIKDEPDSMKPSKWLFVFSASVYVITMFTRSMALFTPVFIMVRK
ncbi:monocarboxylate transporter 13-like [Lingula anatina]|uniref:Monocarboxylate transporter 13-like n=1 Tax=Lingula anatina TaxID=7574 RepID=A0A1S3HJY0_LINAN|nr:monocarboxylate transporter 13-like [Lingula anatina]|eukprot:XP_013385761.1 monocarboxylate transporter 13-like [Lingula anatina]